MSIEHHIGKKTMVLYTIKKLCENLRQTSFATTNSHHFLHDVKTEI